jgi:hypothetical protein
MKFDTLGKAVVSMYAVGIDTLDIMIIHLVKVGQWTTVGQLVNECADIASQANVHRRIKHKLVPAKILRLEESKEDGRTKYVHLGEKFSKIADKLEKLS